MKKIILVLVLIFYSNPSLAKEPQIDLIGLAEQKANPLIESCNQLYDRRERKTDADMIQASDEISSCLENEITKMSDILFDKPRKKEFFASLKKLKESTNDVYAAAYLGNKKCYPCGSAYDVLYRGYYRDSLENLLKTMIAIAYEKELITGKK